MRFLVVCVAAVAFIEFGHARPEIQSGGVAGLLNDKISKLSTLDDKMQLNIEAAKKLIDIVLDRKTSTAEKEKAFDTFVADFGAKLGGTREQINEVRDMVTVIGKLMEYYDKDVKPTLPEKSKDHIERILAILRKGEIFEGEMDEYKAELKRAGEELSLDEQLAVMSALQKVLEKAKEMKVDNLFKKYGA